MNISNYGAPQLMEVQYVQIPQGHTPTWQHILPQANEISRGETIRLTAINKREFTIYSMRHGCSIPELLFLSKPHSTPVSCRFVATDTMHPSIKYSC